MAAISGSFLLRHRSGQHPLLCITEGTISPLVITLPIIMSLIEFGSRATGKTIGLPMGGRGSGFRAIGNIGDKRKGLKFFLQSLSFLRLYRCSCSPSVLPEVPNAEYGLKVLKT